MHVDDLLPYPLAGADSGPGQAGSSSSEQPLKRTGRSLRTGAVVLSFALVVLSILLAGMWRAERQRVVGLESELAQLRDAAARADAAARDSVAEPLTEAQAYSAEMVVASAGVGRFLDVVELSADSATADVFIAAFFGIPKTTTAWVRLEGRRGTSGVLGSIDDPAQPSLIWVSRRSSLTVDPSIPSRGYCLQLDIAAIVQSVLAQRQWGVGADTAPLRWWSDVYAFVPPDQCGS